MRKPSWRTRKRGRRRRRRRKEGGGRDEGGGTGKLSKTKLNKNVWQMPFWIPPVSPPLSPRRFCESSMLLKVKAAVKIDSLRPKMKGWSETCISAVIKALCLVVAFFLPLVLSFFVFFYPLHSHVLGPGQGRNWGERQEHVGLWHFQSPTCLSPEQVIGENELK